MYIDVFTVRLNDGAIGAAGVVGHDPSKQSTPSQFDFLVLGIWSEGLQEVEGLLPHVSLKVVAPIEQLTDNHYASFRYVVGLRCLPFYSFDSIRDTILADCLAHYEVCRSKWPAISLTRDSARNSVLPMRLTRLACPVLASLPGM